MTNQDTASRTLYELTDQGDGTYALSEQFTQAVSYSSKLHIGGSVAAGDVAQAFTVLPDSAHAPLCSVDRVATSGSLRTGGTAQIMVRCRQACAASFRRLCLVVALYSMLCRECFIRGASLQKLLAANESLHSLLF